MPAVLRWKAWPLVTAAFCRGDRTPPCCAVRSAWIGEALADRIVLYRDILSDIVSYLSFSLTAVSCHH